MRMRARGGATLLEQPCQLLAQQWHVLRPGAEGALGETAYQQRCTGEPAIARPLPDDDRIERLDVVDCDRSSAIIDVDRAIVARCRRWVRAELLQQAWEDNGKQRRIAKDALRRAPVWF